MAGYTYDDYLQRLSVQQVLMDAGYVRNRKDGMRYPSFVRLDEHGQRIRGDKFIVTQNGQRCFQPPVQKTFNVISLIKEHPDFFPEYEVGMNLDLLVNKVCCRLLNTPFEEKEQKVRGPEREMRPFNMDDYRIQQFPRDFRGRMAFRPFFKYREINLATQVAFGNSFVLASRESPDKKGVVYTNLSFLLTIPGGDGKVVGFEERGRENRFGGKSYKGKAAGSNASQGLWIASPAGTSLKDAENVFLFESAYDAMAFYQLQESKVPKIKEAVFVSTGGNPTVGQMQGLIRTAPGASFHLCFDNDAAGHQFAQNFKDVAREEKPFSEVAQAYKDTPGNIEVDHEKESAFFKLPEEVKKQYFATSDLVEDLRTGYLCKEDKDELRRLIKEGFRRFDGMVDDCIIRVDRLFPSEGYKDFNDELIAKETQGDERKAVGCDFDGDGEVEPEESNEEKHRYHR